MCYKWLYDIKLFGLFFLVRLSTCKPDSCPPPGPLCDDMKSQFCLGKPSSCTSPAVLDEHLTSVCEALPSVLKKNQVLSSCPQRIGFKYFAVMNRILVAVAAGTLFSCLKPLVGFKMEVILASEILPDHFHGMGKCASVPNNSHFAVWVSPADPVPASWMFSGRGERD